MNKYNYSVKPQQVLELLNAWNTGVETINAKNHFKWSDKHLPHSGVVWYFAIQDQVDYHQNLPFPITTKRLLIYRKRLPTWLCGLTPFSWGPAPSQCQGLCAYRAQTTHTINPSLSQYQGLCTYRVQTTHTINPSLSVPRSVRYRVQTTHTINPSLSQYQGLCTYRVQTTHTINPSLSHSTTVCAPIGYKQHTINPSLSVPRSVRYRVQTTHTINPSLSQYQGLCTYRAQTTHTINPSLSHSTKVCAPIGHKQHTPSIHLSLTVPRSVRL